MEIAPVHRAAPVFDAGMPARPPVQAGGAPVATELAASASVQQASPGSASGNDVRRAQPEPSPSVERHLTIDTETHQIVSQVVEQQSGDVLSQVPDQALLQLRTYAREMLATLEARRARARLSIEA